MLPTLHAQARAADSSCATRTVWGEPLVSFVARGSTAVLKAIEAIVGHICVRISLAYERDWNQSSRPAQPVEAEAEFLGLIIQSLASTPICSHGVVAPHPATQLWNNRQLRCGCIHEPEVYVRRKALGVEHPTPSGRTIDHFPGVDQRRDIIPAQPRQQHALLILERPTPFNLEESLPSVVIYGVAI